MREEVNKTSDKVWRAEKKRGKWWAVGPEYEFPVRRALVERVVATLNERASNPASRFDDA